MIPIVDHEPTAAVYVTAQRHRDDLVVATVRGEIDLSNISRLEKELAGHEEEPWLVIDLSDVGFCGVVGARLLHETAMRSSTAGRRFEVVDNPAIARLLKATGLGDGVVRRTSIGAESF
jgi:anti-anti-sigma factor